MARRGIAFSTDFERGDPRLARPLRVASVRAVVNYFEDGHSGTDGERFSSRAESLKRTIEKRMDRDLSEAMGLTLLVEIESIRQGSLILALVILMREVPEVAKAIAETPRWVEDLRRTVDDLLEGYVGHEGTVVTARPVPLIVRPAVDADNESGPPNRRESAPAVIATGIILIVALIAAMVGFYLRVQGLSEMQEKTAHRLELVEADMIRMETLLGASDPRVAVPLRLDRFNTVSSPTERTAPPPKAPEK